MNCREIIAKLEKICPPCTAEDWDNVGLLVGDTDQDVQNVYIALDLTDEVLETAIEKGADLIITHHPLIFHGVTKVNNRDFVGRRILTLIQNHISCYAMHTNYDICKMAELSADYLHLTDRKVLCVTDEDKDGIPIGIGRVGKLETPMILENFAALVKEQLKLPQVILYGNPLTEITCCAISTGSGKSMIQDACKAKAQVLVTGDIDHHSGLDAVAQGIGIIDAGHYGTEYIFMEDVKKILNQEFPELKADTAEISFPYTIV